MNNSKTAGICNARAEIRQYAGTRTDVKYCSPIATIENRLKTNSSIVKQQFVPSAESNVIVDPEILMNFDAEYPSVQNFAPKWKMMQKNWKDHDKIDTGLGDNNPIKDMYEFEELGNNSIHLLKNYKTLRTENMADISTTKPNEMANEKCPTEGKLVNKDNAPTKLIKTDNSKMPLKLHLIRERQMSTDEMENKVVWQSKLNNEVSKEDAIITLEQSKIAIDNSKIASVQEPNGNDNSSITQTQKNDDLSSLNTSLQEPYKTITDSGEIFFTRALENKDMAEQSSKNISNNAAEVLQKSFYSNNINTSVQSDQQCIKTSQSSPGANFKSDENTLQGKESNVGIINEELRLNGIADTAPLKSNTHAHQCPFCFLWKLKSTYEEHVNLCASNSQTRPALFSSENSRKNVKNSDRSKSKFKTGKVDKTYKNLKVHKKPKVHNVKRKGHSLVNAIKEEAIFTPKNLGIKTSELKSDSSSIHAGGDNLIRNNAIQSFSWNFEEDVLEMFQSVRNSLAGYDVTLACWDCRSKKTTLSQAHKVLLSAASPVLRTILYINTLKQKNSSFIYLNGVSQLDICYILEFIYKGKVHVLGEHLLSFIAAAKLLKIKGIRPQNNL